MNMKRLMILMVLAVLSTPLLYGQKKPTLMVKVANIKEQQGFVMIAVYDSENEFLGSDMVIGAKVEVDAEVITHRFLDLPYGQYAISVFHDIDSNGELDTNLVGIPKEPYGFSNEGVNMFGMPSFKRAVFHYDRPQQEVEIDLK